MKSDGDKDDFMKTEIENKINKSIDEGDESFPKIKFLTLTIACSARMSYHQEIWNDIKLSINQMFETLNKNLYNQNIIICLNIHNNG